MFDIKKAEENAWREVLYEAQHNGDRLLLAGAIRNVTGPIPDFVREAIAELIEIGNVPSGKKSKWTNRRATPGRRFAKQIRILAGASRQADGSGKPKKNLYEDLREIAATGSGPILSAETIRDIVEKRKTFKGDS